MRARGRRLRRRRRAGPRGSSAGSRPGRALRLRPVGTARVRRPRAGELELPDRRARRLVREPRAPGGRIPVLPPGRGPFPAVVYAHGSGEDRLAFVGVAAWLVARGAVAMTVDQPAARDREPAADAVDGIRRERDRAARAVVDFRRAVDVLSTLPQVDERRIGFVGFSAGARLGAMLAGVERRIDAFVLMSGGASPVSDYLRALPVEDRAAAAALLGDVDPLRYVRRAAPAALFVQNGRRDEIVPRAALVALAEAASRPKRVRWYDAGHGLNVAAFRDQLDWLSKRLRITGPPARGASTGP